MNKRVVKRKTKIQFFLVLILAIVVPIVIVPVTARFSQEDTFLVSIPEKNISRPKSQLSSVPEVKMIDDEFYLVKSSIEEPKLQVQQPFAATGRSFQISTYVASLWTRGENFQVNVYIYLTGYLYADLTIKFEGFDNFPGPDETREVYKTMSVRASGSSSIHTLSCYLPTTASVGLKRAQILVSGKAYYKDIGITPDSIHSVSLMAAGSMKYDYVSKSQTWGYQFIARYGLADLQTYGGLPSSDSMSSISGNPNYYWEGLSNDGFGIPITRAVFRPTEWPILYQAGYLVDNCISYPEYSAEVLTLQVHDLITYYATDTTQETTNADMYTYNYNWRGVCDEFAIVLCSFLRVLNIPCRYMIGYDANYFGDVWCHAWSEVYASGRWTHCDSTWDLFDAPWYYSANFVTMDWVKIYSYGDDGLGKWDSYDDGAYNGKLDCYKDWKFNVDYDGPNNY